VQNNIAEGKRSTGTERTENVLGVSLGSLAEIDSMIATPSKMYDLDADVVRWMESLRRRITAGIFHIQHRRRA
jgi:hypothetical protein